MIEGSLTGWGIGAMVLGAILCTLFFWEKNKKKREGAWLTLSILDDVLRAAAMGEVADKTAKSARGFFSSLSLATPHLDCSMVIPRVWPYAPGKAAEGIPLQRTVTGRISYPNGDRASIANPRVRFSVAVFTIFHGKVENHPEYGNREGMLYDILTQDESGKEKRYEGVIDEEALIELACDEIIEDIARVMFKRIDGSKTRTA